jgi:uncharacterized membrane protein
VASQETPPAEASEAQEQEQEQEMQEAEPAAAEPAVPPIDAAQFLAQVSTLFGRRAARLVLHIPVLYFVVSSQGLTVFARYMIPVIPFLCVGSGYLVSLGVGAMRSRKPAAGVLAAVAAMALAWPSATKVGRLDSLLSKPDNRLLAAGWMEKNLDKSSSLWQTGSVYGKVQFLSSFGNGEWTYDEDGRMFKKNGLSTSDIPELILYQRSALALYSSVSAEVLSLLKSRYALVQTFRTGGAFLHESQYDASDAFFIPLVGLETIQRPGPEFELYLRRAIDEGVAEGLPKYKGRPRS